MLLDQLNSKYLIRSFSVNQTDFIDATIVTKYLVMVDLKSYISHHITR